jgi:hypothetical protein
VMVVALPAAIASKTAGNTVPEIVPAPTGRLLGVAVAASRVRAVASVMVMDTEGNCGVGGVC